jgi:hypothetical protein
LLAIGLAVAQLWAAANNHAMNEDGINYLDMADAYMRGDWQNAINSVWSPMYSWILGPILHLLDPPMKWEFPIAHLVNFVIFLGALVCFEFFWRQVIHYMQINALGGSGEQYTTLPEWALLALGYLLFISSALYQIGIWAVTPDMLMSAFVYLAAGLILRIRLGNDSWRTFILLGWVLGLSYLAKAFMFPLAWIVLGISFFSVGNTRRAIPRVIVGIIAFLLVSAPFITALSFVKGDITFSDAGTLTYARYLNDVPYPHWQGDPPGNGTPEHPSRKILDEPPVYEFASPVGGTYPMSFNPAYWYEGLTLRFDLERQLDNLSFSALFYVDLLARQQASLFFGVLLLYLLSPWQPLGIKQILSKWGLAIVAAAAFGAYAIVHALGRYVGVFVVLFWADLLANARLPNSQTYKRFACMLSLLMCLFMLMNIAVYNLEHVRALLGWGNPHQLAVEGSESPSWPGEVAETLFELGIQSGDKVAVIGYAFGSFWARLARVQIVSEMLDRDADTFYRGDVRLQQSVIEAFGQTRARAIVAEGVPNEIIMDGWSQIGTSNYYVYLLN